ncbi:hypothetical protein [Peribacillus muralis]|nr:hypothetical protein [Peribacillus muralis]
MSRKINLKVISKRKGEIEMKSAFAFMMYISLHMLLIANINARVAA